MTRSSLSKLWILGTLYLSQGIPAGFLSQAVTPLMRTYGFQLRYIGLTSLLSLPWFLKLLWAPLVDGYVQKSTAHRRRFIFVTQMATAGILLFAAQFPPAQTSDFALLLPLFFLVNLFSATQDIATDGMAVDLLSHSERGLANGLQVAAYRLGMVLSGGVLLMYFEKLGWRISMIALAGLLLIASHGVFLIRDAKENFSARGENSRPSRAPHFLLVGSHWLILAMLFLFKVGETLASSMLRPFLIDRGMTLADVGKMVGTVGVAAAVAGAILGGFLAGRFSRREVLLACSVGQALSVGSYIFLAGGALSSDTYMQLIALEYFTSSMATAVLFASMMDFCRPGQSGTDYTTLSVAVLLAQGLASNLSGFVAEKVGYLQHFGISFLLCCVGVLAVATLYPKLPAARLSSSHGNAA